MSISKIKQQLNENKLLRGLIIAAACAFAFVSAMQLSVVTVGEAKTLSEVQAEIRAKNEEIEKLRKQIEEYRTQADSLATQIGLLKAKEAEIQAKIDLSELEKKRLEDQILNTETRISATQERLGDVIVDIFLARDVTPLERALSATDISEFIDKEMAMSVVSNNLRQAARELKLLKSQLDEDKTKVEDLLADQTNQRNSLAATRAEQQHLWDITKGTEQGYQNMKNNAEKERLALEAIERQLLWEQTSGGSNVARQPGQKAQRNFSGLLGCSGYGYPNHAAGLWGSRYGCNYGIDNGYDMWGMYNRECTSYAAWALWTRFGKHVTTFGGMGNAKQWPDTAPKLMGAIANNTPAVGAAAVWDYRNPNSRYGHVMIVEAIYNDGWIKISQFNYGTRPGEYSTMEIPADSAVYVHFRNR